jgi:hypothetical protein
MTIYSKLLKDPRWQKLRLSIFQRDNWACVYCTNAELTLGVHHLVYLRKYNKPWTYPPELLRTVCEDCHTLIVDGVGSCLSCYHHLPLGYACREPEDMLALRCPDWYFSEWV